MHLLTLSENGPSLPAGAWVMEDVNAAQYFLMNQGVRPTMTPWEPDFSRALAHSGSLVVATLGFGDALMLTPVLREMKRRKPDEPIHVACMEAQRQVFLGLPYVDGFVDYPVALDRIGEFIEILTLEHSVEFNEDAKKEHMTDRFAHAVGFHLTGDWTAEKKAELVLSDDERSWAAATFPRNGGKRRLGVHVQAGARIRTYPISQLVPELNKMTGEGWEIAFLGSPGEFRAEKLAPGMVDMSRHGLTWRQTCAFMTTCDCLVAPDSSLMHAAGALDIPCVALFGPFDWKLRTAYYDSVFALHGDGACPMAPCFHSHHMGIPIFPPGGPCNQSAICDEIASIPAARIRAKVLQVARNCPEAPPPAQPA